ncbi:RNA-binding protein, putative [Perkinsus marinus ATCC 50983]|uniref:RNA-binding protein, putative n=1 Tax=Perkinsus marinus (strain ATCC 50983 / TXsc) TaxID=423536 RepID=C5KXT8_PERM5|nr:RNA-binding protein, putative [Perkinsus marinus ATCC 50983]EER10812.1 RNA-binding protein, putative [Perkinsus marinus ATCC 50983]|eukprot:XP_002779017.1 RNA-binding protein, putative [Perkinsus marinus ATCC 50983]
MSRSQAKMTSAMGTAGALRLGRTGNSAEGDSIPLDSTGRAFRQIPWDDGRDGMNLMGMAGEDGPSRTLFISGLPTSFFLEDVVAMFKLFGPMRDVQLVSFPPGCAVVTFDSEQDAERARLTCDNFTFEQTGRRLSVRPMAVDSPDSYEMLNRGSSARHYTHRKVPSTTDETEIAGVFSEFGHVNSAHIIPSRSLGIVSFNTMEEAVNAMTTVNLRMSSGDERVPIHWLASGVHVELDSPVQDE